MLLLDLLDIISRFLERDLRLLEISTGTCINLRKEDLVMLGWGFILRLLKKIASFMVFHKGFHFQLSFEENNTYSSCVYYKYSFSSLQVTTLFIILFDELQKRPNINIRWKKMRNINHLVKNTFLIKSMSLFAYVSGSTLEISLKNKDLNLF